MSQPKKSLWDVAGTRIGVISPLQLTRINAASMREPHRSSVDV